MNTRKFYKEIVRQNGGCEGLDCVDDNCPFYKIDTCRSSEQCLRDAKAWLAANPKKKKPLEIGDKVTLKECDYYKHGQGGVAVGDRGTVFSGPNMVGDYIIEFEALPRWCGIRSELKKVKNAPVKEEPVVESPEEYKNGDSFTEDGNTYYVAFADYSRNPRWMIMCNHVPMIPKCDVHAVFIDGKDKSLTMEDIKKWWPSLFK